MRRHHVRATDGVELSVVEGGVRSGAPIVFVHGYLFSAAAFRLQFTGRLAAHHRLIAMDLRGHGDSAGPRDQAAYEKAQVWADDVARVLDVLDVDRAVLVGWSLGSRVVLNYVWHHGFARVAGLDLVAATLSPASHGPDAGLPPDLRDLLAEDAEARLAATRRFVELCGHPGLGTRRTQEAFVDTAMTVHTDARLGSRAWPLHYAGDLAWLDCPVMISHGLADPLVKEGTAREHARLIPNAVLDLIPAAGHLPFHHNPDHFDGALAEFTARCFSC